MAPNTASRRKKKKKKRYNKNIKKKKKHMKQTGECVSFTVVTLMPKKKKRSGQENVHQLLSLAL